MNTVMYIFQGILSAMFFITGLTKATLPRVKLEKQFPWVTDITIGMARFIGITEILCAVGLILPWSTGIFKVLTPISAMGISLIMFLAIVFVHLQRKEYKEAGLNLLILLMASFVAYGRS